MTDLADLLPFFCGRRYNAYNDWVKKAHGGRMQKVSIDAGFTCVKPQGAFYLFPKALETDDYAFCERAKKYDLLLVPGTDFGCPGYFRASYCIRTETIEKSLPVFKKLAAEYKK